MVFQENWLDSICKECGINIEFAIQSIPEDIWRESLTYSRRGKKSRYRANRFQYIITQFVHRVPEVFKLKNESIQQWQEFLRTIYPDAFQKVSPDTRTKQIVDVDLMIHKGFWEIMEERFTSYPEIQIGKPFLLNNNQLIKREIIKNWITQYLLLSDTILDFYFADQSKSEELFLKNLFDYFLSDTIYAKLLRSRFHDWIIHQDVILEKCFKLSQSSLGSFAAQMFYSELYNPWPVVGMVGGEINERAIKQFKTPGFPQIIVCTDVLKEGENLHIFCDKVIHYGLAWTAGDLEQRVGRVDRYFSKIERRLYESSMKEDVKLIIYYPHMINSLEREQVDRVVKRQLVAERVMDTNLSYTDNSQKEIRQGFSDIPSLPIYSSCDNENHPFRPKIFGKSNSIPTLLQEETYQRKKYYQQLVDEFHTAAKNSGLQVIGGIHDFIEPVDVFVPSAGYPEGRHWRFKLHYVSELGSYAMKGTSLSNIEEFEEQSGKYSFEMDQIGGKENIRKVIRIYLPLITKDIKSISESFSDAFQYLLTSYVKIKENVESLTQLKQALSKLKLKDKVHQERDNKLTTVIEIGKRKQNISVYLYEGMIFLSSRIGREDCILINEMPIDKKRLLMLNSSISFGYFSTHRRYVTFCKRLFWHHYDAEFLGSMIKTVAEQADIYELRFLGSNRF